MTDGRRYGVKAVFHTLQGEGAWAGAPSVFVRLTGCNAWDGHPLHRAQGAGACARWCDTDFHKGRVMGAGDILAAMDAAWPEESVEPGHQRRAVVTGGEPLLQLDTGLVFAMQRKGWAVHVETNGSIDAPAALLATLDHIAVSPKLGLPVHPGVVVMAHEVKVVVPGQLVEEGEGWTEEGLAELERMARREAALYLMPMDPLAHPHLVSVTALVPKTDLHRDPIDPAKPIGGTRPVPRITLEARLDAHVQQCMTLAARRPRWRVGMQLHKAWGLE